MDSDCLLQLIEGHVELHCDCVSLHDFSCVRPQEVDSQDLSVLFENNYLQVAQILLFVEGQIPLQRSEVLVEYLHVVLSVFNTCVLFRESTLGILKRSEYRRGNQRVVNLAPFSFENSLGHDFSLFDCHRGQLDRIGLDVSYGKYVVNVRLELSIGYNLLVFVQLNSDSFESKSLSVWVPSYSHVNVIKLLNNFL